MQIYLPIAEMSVNILVILGMGGLVGFLSGMFGVGGGFLMTPLLIFYGVPPAVAVASTSNQITAASVSGALAHWRRGGVDLRMGLVLVLGGGVGSYLGAMLFRLLKALGQIDLVIALSYVLFLGTIGALMLAESLRAMRRQRRGEVGRRRKPSHSLWIQRLPFKMRFRKSRLYVSVLAPLAIGFIVGILVAVMGVGGGFLMVPALIYLLGMPTNVVVGTSLFQIVFVTAVVTILHSINTHTVDVVLAVLLLVGAVIGAQLGVRAGQKLKGEQLRAMLALIVLGVCLRMGLGLFFEPAHLFTVEEVMD
ncbi:MAG: sulfite exporter TauE/SafE family protein [Pseudomonadota bacterium]